MACALAHLCHEAPGTAASGLCRGRRCRRRLDAAAIRGLPLFDGLDRGGIARLLTGATIEHRSRNALLFQAETPADAFFILLDGRVKLFALTADGQESIVEVVDPVASFAEAAILAGGVYPVTAEVLDEAVLVRVGARGFLQNLRDDADVAARMLASMLRWERRLTAELERLQKLRPMERMADLLISLAPVAEGKATVVLPLKKVVLASRLGMKPETLSRVLARLRDFGVQTQGRTVHIEDVSRLHALCTAPAMNRAAPV